MRIHFIGIKGVSMEFLAELCRRKGIEVTGSDLSLGGHDAKNVVGADEVVYSLAISPDNPEYAEAVRLGIPLISRSRLLGRLASEYGSVVAVAGTHGKTTTTAMLMRALDGQNPTVHVGGYVGGKLGRIGGNDLFVTEACEYKESFLSLAPDAAIVLNVELDHADYYKTYAKFYDAFAKFTAKSKVAFVCGDNDARSLKGAESTITFGLDKSDDYHAEILGQKGGRYTFAAYCGDKKLSDITLNVPGEHNVVSAMAAIAYCHHTGADYRGIEDFTGVDRRFESLAAIDGTEYISDYAHHPHEIECTLRTARSIYRRILVVFEPHTYSRTQAFFGSFVTALSKADGCVMLPIYAARELPIKGVSSAELAKAGGFMLAKNYDEAGEILGRISGAYDAVIFMGAGTVDEFARAYVRNKK